VPDRWLNLHSCHNLTARLAASVSLLLSYGISAGGAVSWSADAAWEGGDCNDFTARLAAPFIFADFHDIL